jgi:hypothetical protein
MYNVEPRTFPVTGFQIDHRNFEDVVNGISSIYEAKIRLSLI